MVCYAIRRPHVSTVILRSDIFVKLSLINEINNLGETVEWSISHIAATVNIYEHILKT